MGRDPTGGGYLLFGAPWWVMLIGLVMAVCAVGLARLWWNVRMTRAIRVAVRQRRAAAPDPDAQLDGAAMREP